MKTIKQTIQMFLVLAVCVTVIMSKGMNVQAAAQMTIAFDPGNSVSVGDTVTVTVTCLSDAGEEASTDMSISYNSDVLEYVSSNSGTGGAGAVNATGSSVTIKYKAKAAGSAKVVAEGVSAVAGGATLTVVDKAASLEPEKTTDTATNENTKTNPAEEEPTTTEETEAATSDDSSGESQVTIDEKTYFLSEDFTEKDIPSGFVSSVIEYDNNSYSGAIYEHGQIGLLYLVNSADEQDRGFFIYDATSNSIYPFIQVTTGSKSLILMVPAAGNVPPSNYNETTITYKEIGTIKAYEYDIPTSNETEEYVASSTQVEVVDTEVLEDTEVLGDNIATTNPFYLVYAIDEVGVMGWYQYDSVQDTFQRLNESVLSSATDAANYDSLLESYNKLSARFKALKASNRNVLIGLVLVAAILLIVLINLLLKLSELKKNQLEYDDLDEDSLDNDHEEDSKDKRKSLFGFGRKKEWDEEDFDEDEDELDEEYSISPKEEKDIDLKKEKKENRNQGINNKDSASAKKNVAEEDDEDIEFLDLNK